MTNVRRIYVEKRKEYATEAHEIQTNLVEQLGLTIHSLRIVHRYDVQGISEEILQQGINTILAEPMVDHVYDEIFPMSEKESVFAIEFLPGHNEVRQRASRNSQAIPVWLWLFFSIFFYFFVVLVVNGQESLELWAFSRQPERQRAGNEAGNGAAFSERQLHLLRRFHKIVLWIFRRVAGPVVTFPPFLPAILPKHPWIGKVFPPGSALVHDLIHFPDLPLFRFIIRMVQGFFVKLLGADSIPRISLQICLDHPCLGVLRHKILLAFLQVLRYLRSK